MWLTGYFYYTSVGVDSERNEFGELVTTYYRVRWPGNGSLWIGGGQVYGNLEANTSIERLDLAGTFFQPPRHPKSENILNTLGFWWIDDGRQIWLGIPAWLPVLIFLGMALRKYRQVRSHAHLTTE